MMGCMSGSFAQGNGGTTGPLTWNLENDTLKISGNGDMPDYSLDWRPWCQKIYSGTGSFTISCPFHIVIIENGVTSIGNSAFLSASNVESVSIPNSITSIGEGSFYGCSFTTITLPYED